MSERKGSIELVILLSLVLCAFLVGLGLYYRLPPPQTLLAPAEGRALDVDQLIRDMATLRGLTLLRPIPWETLSATALQERALATRAVGLSEDDLASRQEVLTFLGLLPPNSKLENLLLDLRGQTVLGLYDPRAKKLWIPSSDNLGVSEQLTLAHELVHGLEDQHFELSKYTRPAFSGNDDELNAAQCLVEGDAGWAQALYTEANQSVGTNLSLFLATLNQQSRVLDSAPLYVHDWLQLPYESGLPFVKKISQNGGWVAVNQAFASLPRSTEQVLHPEKYTEANDPPVNVEIPAYPEELANWILVRDNVLGEFDFRTWFRTFLPQADADRDAAGWGGCRYQLWRNGNQHVFILNSSWDSADDAWEAQYAIELWLKYRFQIAPEVYFQGGLFSSSEETAIIYPAGKSVQLVMAPDRDLALGLLKALP
jgi:hypothetical protein